MKPTPEAFALLCYLTLMEPGTGLQNKAPSYIFEKQRMLKCGYDAFAYLDINNMRHVMNYCRLWGVEIPPLIEDAYADQERAFDELKAQGIEL